MTRYDATALKKVGFVDVGRWELDGTEITFCLEGLPSEAERQVYLNTRKALYAFVQDDTVQYIGKTARTIQQRLVGYCRPHRGQVTNVRCNGWIKSAAESGIRTRIYVFVPTAHLQYAQFDIDLAAGLEDALIADFKPGWNGRGEKNCVLTEGAEREEMAEGAGTPPSGSGQAMPTRTMPAMAEFKIALGEAYYNQGLINPGIGPSHYLGGHGELIEIVFEDGARSVTSSINRNANGNGSVRVVGHNKSIADWFKRNYRWGDIVAARVLTANQILLLCDQGSAPS